MLVAQSPISSHHRPRSGRKPLQPKNSSSSPFDTILKPNLKAAAADRGEISISNSNSISISENNNKENVHPIFSTPTHTPTPTPTPAATKSKKQCFEIESLDASLAEELSAIREKLERLRIDKDKTDKMLKERGLMLDSQMKEFIDRGMLQKHLEVEVDRLFRLKEIKLSCTSTSVSPLRSLREKEQQKKKMQNQEQHQLKAKNHSENMRDEQKDKSPSDSQVKTTEN